MSAVQGFLRSHSITSNADLAPLLHAVAEMPWGEARTLEEVLNKGCGTCTGKHVLLQACFDELGIVYRPVVCTFRWQDQNLDFPEGLQKILDATSWVHGHNFVQIQGEGSTWIDIDITWDSPLGQYGFQFFPSDWDGQTSFVAVNDIVARWDGVSIADKKKDLIASLSEEERIARGEFLEKFIIWIDSLR